MTRIILGRDEWWPVPEIREIDEYDDGVEIDQAIIDRYTSATEAFVEAWSEIAKAAAAAGDTYWQANS